MVARSLYYSARYSLPRAYFRNARISETLERLKVHNLEHSVFLNLLRKLATYWEG